MNQLIIIGNGFDLEHGLKTSYEDFVLWYLNRVYFDREHQRFDINNDLACISGYQFESKFECISKIDESIEHYGCSYRCNIFFESIKRGTGIHGWVDIEKLYFDKLLHHLSNTIRQEEKYIHPEYIKLY